VAGEEEAVDQAAELARVWLSVVVAVDVGRMGQRGDRDLPHDIPAGVEDVPSFQDLVSRTVLPPPVAWNAICPTAVPVTTVPSSNVTV
jgi:hypothetical protein